MRLIHVVSSFGLGGAERVAYDLATEQVRSGDQVLIVAVQQTPEADQAFSRELLSSLDERIAFRSIASRHFQLSLPLLAWRLGRLVPAHEPSIVHAHVDPAEFIVSLLGRTRRLRVVRTIHNTVLWPTRQLAAYVSEAGLAKAAVAAVSQDALQAYIDLRSRLRLPLSPRMRVIHNGVPLAPLAGGQHGRRGVRFAYFGRSKHQKGLDILLEALAIAQQRGVFPSIDIYSDLQPEAVAAERSRLAGGTVRFHCPTPSARREMANYDVIVMPSRFEGFGLVAIEALNAGVPVLVSDAPGLREVMPPEWPWTVPVANARALADRMIAISALDAVPPALRMQGQFHARRFDIALTAAAYRELYDQVLRDGPGDRG